MAYRYRSRRSSRRLAQRSKRNFIITLVLITFLLYATVAWILPYFITGLGFIKGFLTPSQKVITNKIENTSLAPPVLNIPFEATSTAQINIKGYTTPHSKVKLFLDDEVRQTVETSAEGDFIISDVSLSLGTNNIYAKTLDEKDQESLPSKTISVVYDNEKPLLEVSEPEDGKSIQGERRLKVAGKTEAEAKVFVNDSQTVVKSDGGFSTEISLNDGDNPINIKAVDKAGNSNEISRKVTFSP